MRIAVDTRPLSYRLTGIGFYLYCLLDAIESLDRQNQYFLISNAPIKYRPKNKNWTKIEGTVNRKMLSSPWMQTLGVVRSMLGAVDLFWGTRHHLPVMLPPSMKAILTIHDVIHRRYPETLSLPNLIAERILMRWSLHKADAVITDSYSTASDLHSFYRVDPAKIHTIHPGVPRFNERRSVTDSHFKKLPNRYFLYVGTLEPRKNLKRILKAYDLLKPECHDIHLMLVGGEGWKNTGFLELLNGHHLKSKIHVTGYVTRDYLTDLYRHALCLLFPSLYEGFGFPILEAMSVGTPVVTSRTSSMSEVAGNAALLVDPMDIKDIATAMNTVAVNGHLRQQLIEKGLKRADMFSWERCAQKTIDVINTTMKIIT